MASQLTPLSYNNNISFLETCYSLFGTMTIQSETSLSEKYLAGKQINHAMPFFSLLRQQPNHTSDKKNYLTTNK